MTGARRKCGFTLVSVMVGISLAMIASVAALATFQVLRDSYAVTADSVLIEERGQRALAIIAHAVRNIPRKHTIMEKCYPPKITYHQGLPPHKYHSGGTLQWAFMN